MSIPINGKTFRIFLVLSVLCLLAIYLHQFHAIDSLPMGRRALSKHTTPTITTRFSEALSISGPSKRNTTTKTTNKTYTTSNEATITSDSNTSTTFFHALSRGHYIRAGTKDIAIVTAVHNPFKPDNKNFNVLLNGWAHVRRGLNLDFKCCFLNSLKSRDDILLEIPSKRYHLYTNWIVDMQSAEFSCTIPSINMKYFNESVPVHEPFKYVTFAETSCKDAPKDVLPIEYRQTIPDSVVICLKITYGTIHLELLVEWMEYQRMVGVTKVFSFLAEDLDEDVRQVFRYYAKIGFVEIDPIYPAPKNNGTSRGFRKPRFEEQAWVDEVMAINDCKHRYAGMSFVIVHDVDEWIVPNLEEDNVLTILKKAALQYPQAGAFQLDANVAMLDWGETRASPLNVMRATNITTFTNYDDRGRQARHAFIPDKFFFGSNNFAYPTKGHDVQIMPSELYTLIHRRYCKYSWKGCNRTNIRAPHSAILRYERQLVRNVHKLPLEHLLNSTSSSGQHADYIAGIRKWVGENV